MKKKILIIGNKEKFTLEYFYYKSFKYLGSDVDFFSIDRTIKNRLIAKIINIFPNLYYFFLRKKLINYIKNNKKKYLAIIIFKGLYLDLYTIKNIKALARKTIWLNIFPDDPFNVRDVQISNINFFKTISEFDIFCIWSKKIKKKLDISFKKKIFLYLPFAYDNLVNFKLNKKKIGKNKQLLFVGTHDNAREKIINSIKIDKKIYGGNWKYRSFISKSDTFGHLHGKQLSHKINNAMISLNILRKQNLSSHNMKTFEIPGNNGLMLTTRSKEQNNFFKENFSCFMYSNIHELNKKIEFILNNTTLSLKVRKRGNMIAKKHSYLERTKYLLKKINDVSKSKKYL